MDKKILVAEYDKMLQTAIAGRLRDDNFIVLTAADGQETLLAALNDHPDLIILDTALPIKTGFIVIEELRKDSWGKNVPIIILSDMEDIKQELKDISDKYDFLVKNNLAISTLIGKVKAKFLI